MSITRCTTVIRRRSNSYPPTLPPAFCGRHTLDSIIGICVALPNKLETIVGLFGVGEQPTGDKDPFGLRRQAVGSCAC